MRAVWSSSLSSRTSAADPCPACSVDWMLRAQVEDARLELLLLGLQLARGLDQRRPLLRRVADARTLGGQLGGDEEAEPQQRRPEGDLPARDGAQSRRHGRQPLARAPRSASHTRSPTPARRPGRRSEQDDPQRHVVPGGRSVLGGRRRRRRRHHARWRTWHRRPGRAARAASQPTGTGPGGPAAGHAGRAPGAEVRQPGVVERRHVHPDRRAERLVVGASVGVGADERRPARPGRGSGSR